MSDDSRRLYGQARALSVVREFMERPEQDRHLRNRRSPVLIFTGSRAIGKTALLASLAHHLDQRVPYARIDFETTDAAAPYEVLAAVAIELNRHCSDYGRLGFPRFVVGKIVMAQELDFTDHDRVRGQIQRVLEEHRNVPKLREFLHSLAPELEAAMPGLRGLPGAGTVIGHLPDVLLDGLVSWRIGRRVLLGKGQSWYGHQDRGLTRDPLDVLAELNLKSRRPDVGNNRREVAELLLAAFLADLRDAFSSGRRAGKRPLNCVVLLDNADVPVGRSFLEELVRARGHHAADAPDDPDPVTFVATSRGELVARVTSRGQEVVVLDGAGLDDYGRRSGAGHWYPVALRHLAEEEVDNMVAALGLRNGSDRRIAAAVYQFTQGHPGSTSLVLDAIAEQPDGPFDLLLALAQPEPGGLGTRTVRARLLDSFLHGSLREEGPMGDLVTCAAACELDEASGLAAHSGLLTDPRVEPSAVFQPELWIAKGDGSLVMQPVLRRLLQPFLAARAEGEPANWSRVHGWLCERATRQHDEPAALYHTLAQGHLEIVARRLASLLSDTDVVEWLRLLRFVVAAPLSFEPSLTPMDQVQALTRWTDPRDLPLAPIARLVTTLWIGSDPLAGSRRRSLHLTVAAAYDEIAPHSLNGLAVLNTEASWHRGLADLWR